MVGRIEELVIPRAPGVEIQLTVFEQWERGATGGVGGAHEGTSLVLECFACRRDRRGVRAESILKQLSAAVGEAV